MYREDVVVHYSFMFCQKDALTKSSLYTQWLQFWDKRNTTALTEAYEFNPSSADGESTWIAVGRERIAHSLVTIVKNYSRPQVYVGFVPQVYVGIKIFRPENKIDAGRLRSTLRS